MSEGVLKSTQKLKMHSEEVFFWNSFMLALLPLPLAQFIFKFCDFGKPF